MDDTALGILLCILFVYIVLDLDKLHGSFVHNAARHPFARFLAGLFVVLVARLNPAYGMFALGIVFLWIADVNLLSSFEF